MKKWIPLMIMLLVFSFSVSAAAPTPSGDDTGVSSGANAAASAQVLLDMSQSSIIELWFADSPIAAGARMPESYSGSVSLTLNGSKTGTVYDNANDKVYACWYISGGKNVDVELQVDQPLSRKGGDETIAWKVMSTNEVGTSKDVTVTSGTTAQTSEGFLSYTYTQGRKPASGCASLAIETTTTNYTNIPIDTYSAYLTLRVVNGD